jgi:ribosomal protein L24E|tara:strand:- start:1065 stop:1241 length:177 start_codon:yes stop_codon:yes gene_type:complete
MLISDFKIEKKPIAMGAGHWIQRWFVEKDGRILTLSDSKEEAETYVATKVDNWTSRDE